MRHMKKVLVLTALVAASAGVAAPAASANGWGPNGDRNGDDDAGIFVACNPGAHSTWDGCFIDFGGQPR